MNSYGNTSFHDVYVTRRAALSGRLRPVAWWRWSSTRACPGSRRFAPTRAIFVRREVRNARTRPAAELATKPYASRNAERLCGPTLANWKNISRASAASSASRSICAGRTFNSPAGTRCWQIPYGETRTYADIARAVGRPTGFRAVGMANNRNPVAIVVPCHRVIASDGTLCGYGGGLDVKRKLLELEGALSGTLAA